MPLKLDTNIKPGDTVLVHHNVFRRWYDVKGVEKISRAFFNENTYIVSIDQIFLFKSKQKWQSPKGYCFVKPIKAIDQFSTELEKPLVGIVKYSDKTVSVGDLVGQFSIRFHLIYSDVGLLVLVSIADCLNR